VAIGGTRMAAGVGSVVAPRSPHLGKLGPVVEIAQGGLDAVVQGSETYTRVLKETGDKHLALQAGLKAGEIEVKAAGANLIAGTFTVGLTGGAPGVIVRRSELRVEEIKALEEKLGKITDPALATVELVQGGSEIARREADAALAALMATLPAQGAQGYMTIPQTAKATLETAKLMAQPTAFAPKVPTQNPDEKPRVTAEKYPHLNAMMKERLPGVSDQPDTQEKYTRLERALKRQHKKEELESSWGGTIRRMVLSRNAKSGGADHAAELEIVKAAEQELKHYGAALNEFNTRQVQKELVEEQKALMTRTQARAKEEAPVLANHVTQLAHASPTHAVAPVATESTPGNQQRLL
jgi:hypothetical protein